MLTPLAAARSAAEQDAATATQTAGFLTRLLSASIPQVQSPESITVRELLDQGAKEIRTGLMEQPEVRARLLMTMGEAYTSLALLDDAERLLSETLLIQQAFDPNSLEMARVLSLKGLVSLESRQFEEAMADLERGLAIARQHTGKRSLVAQGEIHDVIGGVHYETGEIERAIDSYERAYVLLVEGDGVRHPSVLPALSNLAAARYSARDY